MVYDGLGNPVGFVPSYGYRTPGVRFQPPSPYAPGVSVTPPAFRTGGTILQRPGMTGPNPFALLPVLQRLRSAMAQAHAQGQAPNPQLVARYQRMLQWYRNRMQALRAGGASGIPPGWMHRPTPYTGVRANRLYMRCATWLGPAGLVPTSAVQTAAAAAPPPAAAAGRRRRRRRR